ncbi:hypothetical protein QTP70_010211 [Hemibagrus guttatus]|uniref:Endonuclease/exonuclease/phosphatase domain-containing protein n=1 Tax=Hemibagrus guttatus TaxID=175788 RepID=A0AAE0UHQ8_9TELE|nr:hypothetical protein QTP70_010211 [Hemibagrus guttatus]
MTEKGRELADMMERRKVDILCVQETRWKGSKARSIGAGFKLFYYGVDSKRNGVGVVLKEEFERNVLEVKRVSDRVMSLKLEIEGVMLNVVSGYAPQVGCELEEKVRFWSELDEVMESIPTGERVVIGADFNGHVGEGNTGDEEVMGKFGVKERNLEGQMVVDFAKRMDMAVVNTYFQKREEHRVTYKSGGRRTQVDYILCRRGNLKEISDCKVVVGESVARQHRMVVCRMTLMVCKKKRSKIEIEKKTKWWKMKKEECCEEFRQKLRQALGGQVVLPDDWETTAEVIRETGRKVLGVSSGRRKEDKETWWWNEEVQDSIQRKRLAKKKWDMDRTEENRQEYKELQRRVKREVSKAKQKAYDELYTRLDTREGQKDLYRLIRQRDRDGKDVQQVRVIKDRDGRVLISEENVQRRRKEYFEELMNEENERAKRVEGVNSVEQKVDKIRKDEVRKALKRMKSGKAVGPDDIPVEGKRAIGEHADCEPLEHEAEISEGKERGSVCPPGRGGLDLQHALGHFAAECEVAGMRVSTSKSEAMVLDRKKVACTLQVGGEVLPQVEEFKYLGVLFTSEGRMDREIDRRIGAAAAVMRSMYWSVVVKKELSWKVKLSIYVPTLTYGHELWVMTERVRSRIQAAEMSFLRRVAGRSLRDRVRSSVTRQGLGVEPLLLHIERGQLRWLGHLFQMPPGRLPGEVFWACPTGKRPRGRPRTRWRDYVSRLAWERLGVPPEELEEVARERLNTVQVNTLGKQENTVPSFIMDDNLVGCELEEKVRFWSELDEVMESIPTGERVVIGADFNGHVGEGNTGDEEVMGKFGVKERNLEGQTVVDFAKRMDMGVVNTYFQKREEHRVTYKSGDRSTQVD